MCVWYLCVCRGSKYFKVVSDWLILDAKLYRTILVGGPLRTQFDDKISSFKNIGQQKVGSKSSNHFANLQIMCKTNIRIWDCFYHNCFGNCHHKNTKSQELFH